MFQLVFSKNCFVCKTKRIQLNGIENKNTLHIFQIAEMHEKLEQKQRDILKKENELEKFTRDLAKREKKSYKVSVKKLQINRPKSV